jgi:hypothetical protein
VFEDLDGLARGLAENDVSRRQAIKWAGYSVLGTALSSMGFAQTAEAEDFAPAARRRLCRRIRGAFCSHRRTCGRGICCNPDPKGRHRKACCGTEECNCCRLNQRCTRKGRCR